LTKAADKFLSRVKQDLIKATKQQGQRVVKDIQADVPVKSGHLRDSATSEVVDLGHVVRLAVANTADYALWVERGHLARGADHVTEVPPNPFMLRSQLREKQQYVKQIARGMK
jgi:hypothetical protein